MNELKIYCNNCFNELEVHTYDIGVYVDNCKYCDNPSEELLDDVYSDGYNDGHDDGLLEGKN